MPTAPALLTDLYQLTMAFAHFRNGHSIDACFHLYFRSNPFKGGFAISCGLAAAVDYLRNFHFSPDDLAYLATLKGNDGNPLFDQPFLTHLANLKLQVDIDAIPEGTVVFANEPLVRVTGPILHCQLLETTLLNLINFETLVATKSARICLAAQGQNVLEFGLRRAQGPDGALSASRAAYVGGCAATSNLLAGKLFNIPVRGTHAHSWVMSHDSELEAFDAYADALPNNVVLLVDTYDTLQGVRHAAQIGQKLQSRGHKLIGIRLDSGDLAYLSIEARKILDAAGLPDAAILASNDLDEHLIESLKHQGATITTWGVGTKLATAHDQPALGGVYKLGAVRHPTSSAGGPGSVRASSALSPSPGTPGEGRGEGPAPSTPSDAWIPKIKLSEQTAKVSTPGRLQVRRFSVSGSPVADCIYDLTLGVDPAPTLIDPSDPNRHRPTEPAATHQDLLTPIMRAGQLTYTPPPASEARSRTLSQLKTFHPTLLRLTNPHRYPVGLEPRLATLRQSLIQSSRTRKPSATDDPNP